MGAEDLTTIGNLKEWLGIQSNTDDNMLSRLITAISDEVLTYLGRSSLVIGNYTETRDGTGTSTLAAKQFPLISVASLSIDSVAINPSLGGVQPGFTFDQFVLKLIGVPPMLLAGGVSSQYLSTPWVFREGKNNIVFTYSAGLYTAQSGVPLDLEQAVIDLISKRYLARKRIGIVSNTSKTGESTRYDTEQWQQNPPVAIARLRRLAPV